MECAMTKRRRRFKQNISLKDRLTAWAETVRTQANQLRPGPEREMLLEKARQADAAAHLDDWINSTGLQPPR
jgi:hypothetical protein